MPNKLKIVLKVKKGPVKAPFNILKETMKYADSKSPAKAVAKVGAPSKVAKIAKSPKKVAVKKVSVKKV